MKRPQSLGLEQFFCPLNSRLFFFIVLLAMLEAVQFMWDIRVPHTVKVRLIGAVFVKSNVNIVTSSTLVLNMQWLV
jgi:hypothetical protein